MKYFINDIKTIETRKKVKSYAMIKVELIVI